MSPESVSEESWTVKRTVGEAGGCVILGRGRPPAARAACTWGECQGRRGQCSPLLSFGKYAKVQIMQKKFYAFPQEPS